MNINIFAVARQVGKKMYHKVGIIWRPVSLAFI